MAAGGSFEAARWSCCCRLWSWPRRSRSEPRLPGAGCAWLVSAVPRAPEVRTFGAHLPLKARRSRVPSGARGTALRSHRPARGRRGSPSRRGAEHVAQPRLAPQPLLHLADVRRGSGPRRAPGRGRPAPGGSGVLARGSVRPLLLVAPPAPAPGTSATTTLLQDRRHRLVPPRRRVARWNARSMGEISSVVGGLHRGQVLLDLGEPRWPGDARGRQRCGGRLQDPAHLRRLDQASRATVRDHPESSQQVAGLQLRDVDARTVPGLQDTRARSGRGSPPASTTEMPSRTPPGPVPWAAVRRSRLPPPPIIALICSIARSVTVPFWGRSAPR